MIRRILHKQNLTLDLSFGLKLSDLITTLLLDPPLAATTLYKTFQCLWVELEMHRLYGRRNWIGKNQELALRLRHESLSSVYVEVVIII